MIAAEKQDIEIVESSQIPTPIVRRIVDAWIAAGIPHALQATQASGRHLAVVVKRLRREAAVRVALSTLNAAGWRACVDRTWSVWSLFGFQTSDGKLQALRIDFTPSGPRALHWIADAFRGLFAGRAPCVAMAGPDGVGKSTALGLVAKWLTEGAPFLTLLGRQWRPTLLPALSSLAGKKSVDVGKPRRSPGNLHLVRLVYYWIDFVIGGLWKDWRRRSQARLIVYDRCALDMAVDPYRFALTSTFGTGLLWKTSPRPNAVVLLYDEPERVYQRKRELEKHEIEEQLGIWLDLAAKDEVHAIIRIDGGPEQIARRLLAVMLDVFIRFHDRGPGPAVSSEDRLPWVGNILTGGSPDLEFVSGERSPRSARIVAEFAVAPSKSNPRFLIPLEDGPAATRSLDLYNPQKPLARLSRSILSGGLRLGIAQPLLPDRFTVQRRKDTKPGVDGSTFIGDHLRTVLGLGKLSVSVSLGTPGPNQKPVLQLMNGGGDIIGYAKLGCSEGSTRLIRNEELTLRRLEGKVFTTARVPRVLHAGAWRQLYVLVQDAPGAQLGHSPLELDERHIQFLEELHALQPGRGPLPMPEEQQIAEIHNQGFPYYAHILSYSRSFCEERVGDALVPLGPLHGDFSPWNIRMLGDRLLVVDWEYGRPQAPAGWDLFHFLMATAVEVRDQSAGRIYRKIVGPGPTDHALQTYFVTVGADPGLVAPLFAAYLAKALTRSLTALGTHVSVDEEQLRGTYGRLLATLCHKGGQR